MTKAWHVCDLVITQRQVAAARAGFGPPQPTLRSSVQLRLPRLHARPEPGRFGRELGLPALDVRLHPPGGAAGNAGPPLPQILELVRVHPQRWRWYANDGIDCGDQGIR